MTADFSTSTTIRLSLAVSSCNCQRVSIMFLSSPSLCNSGHSLIYYNFFAPVFGVTLATQSSVDRLHLLVKVLFHNWCNHCFITWYWYLYIYKTNSSPRAWKLGLDLCRFQVPKTMLDVWLAVCSSLCFSYIDKNKPCCSVCARARVRCCASVHLIPPILQPGWQNFCHKI